MPLNKKGKKIKKAMQKQYGKKKGEKVFYAMENSGKLKKVTKARGGKDMGTVAGSSRPARDDKAIADRMSKTQQAADLKKTKDVPFKKPLSTAQSIALSQIIPFGGPLVNYGAKQQYKSRQKFARKKGLYRDFYRSNQTPLQPNAPIGKEYLKDAGFGRRAETEPNRDGPQKPILPIPVTPIEQIKTETSPYKKPTVVDGVFNYSVGLKKGGMLRQGKPKLAKKGWK
jgi:hypothetical protein